MRIIFAKHLGMCKGLRLIMHKTKKEISRSSDPIYIYKDLVHNNQTHEELIKLGAKAQIFSTKEIPKNSRVIVGPHSASATTLKEISEKAKLVDTSCHVVLNVPKMAKKLMSENDLRLMIFVGTKDHEEADLVKKEAEIFNIPLIVLSYDMKIPHIEKNERLIGVVAQTTYTENKFKEKIKELKEFGHNVVYNSTICSETILRQESIIELVKKVNKMIIVGGKKSNNTKFLAETSSKYVKTWQVEKSEEIKDEWFNKNDVVGISAGASTSDLMVDGVSKRLNEIANKKLGYFLKMKNLFNTSRAKTKMKIANHFFKVVEQIQAIKDKKTRH